MTTSYGITVTFTVAVTGPTTVWFTVTRPVSRNALAPVVGNETLKVIFAGTGPPFLVSVFPFSAKPSTPVLAETVPPAGSKVYVCCVIWSAGISPPGRSESSSDSLNATTVFLATRIGFGSAAGESATIVNCGTAFAGDGKAPTSAVSATA